MKKEMRIGVICLASFAMAAALWAFAPKTDTATAATAASTVQTPASSQSVSGKIASVESTSFTLTVAAEQKSNTSETSVTQTGQTAARSMTFSIDSNTTIDGKLKVGANADVTYRTEGSKYVAISVRVS